MNTEIFDFYVKYLPHGWASGRLCNTINRIRGTADLYAYNHAVRFKLWSVA
jgi:hypothetical protein